MWNEWNHRLKVKLQSAFIVFIYLYVLLSPLLHHNISSLLVDILINILFCPFSCKIYPLQCCFFKRRSNVRIEKPARSYSFIHSSSMTISVFWKALCCAWKTHWSTITQSPHLFNSMTYAGASCLSLNASSFDSLHLDHCVSWHERTWQQQVHENVGHIVRDERVILPPLEQQGHPSDLLPTQEVIRRHSCLLTMLFSL